LFNCLSRLYVPSEGEILFEGRSILSAPRHAIAALGIGRTFQNVALFDKLTVRDNILIGCHSQSTAGFIASALKGPATRAEERRLRETADRLITFMDIEAFADRRAGGLPFPIRKRVELARALGAKPKLLLLDDIFRERRTVGLIAIRAHALDELQARWLRAGENDQG
ncbi:MAG TPA: ATP-binding cassette domain-containing protein, partial [Hyphomicrobiaceae bacterium]|nr:ATP-binding cassette domain-containing protein [Hyphomicrobiaceae bacterium]